MNKYTYTNNNVIPPEQLMEIKANSIGEADVIFEKETKFKVYKNTFIGVSIDFDK